MRFSVTSSVVAFAVCAACASSNPADDSSGALGLDRADGGAPASADRSLGEPEAEGKADGGSGNGAEAEESADCPSGFWSDPCPEGCRAETAFLIDSQNECANLKQIQCIAENAPPPTAEAGCRYVTETGEVYMTRSMGFPLPSSEAPSCHDVFEPEHMLNWWSYPSCSGEWETENE